MQRSDSNGLQGRNEVFLKHESEINTPVSHRRVWNVWINRATSSEHSLRSGRFLDRWARPV